LRPANGDVNTAATAKVADAAHRDALASNRPEDAQEQT